MRARSLFSSTLKTMLPLAMLFAIPAFSQSSSSVKSGKTAQVQDNSPKTIAKLQLETNEALFSTLAALNACGFDMDLSNSDPLRAKIRSEITDSINASLAASNAREQLCRFHQDKQQPDAGRDLAQYVSLALYMKDAPDFGTSLRESDLPPDAYEVLGFIPLLKNFYEAVGLHAIWTRHSRDYERLIAAVQPQVSDMILKTDFYLRLPVSSYLGRRYLVFVEPMGAPSQVNARNFGSDYYLVISPSASGVTRLEQIRHTYLHFILDTLTMRRANVVKRLDPLLFTVKDAPMDDSFKNDTALLVVESLIQAIEARTFTPPDGKKDKEALEKARNEEVEKDMKQGYILTRYFYDAMIKFEQGPTGLRDAFPEMLAAIDVDREKRRAANTVFATKATPEVVRAAAASKKESQLLDFAEQQLAKGDTTAAHRFAQQALDEQQGDPARATFVLARAAVLDRDMDGAQQLFERTLQMAHEPRTVAWSHIYIGRILDMKCDRNAALSHYKTALTFSEPAPDIKAAADRGIKELPPASCGKEDKE